MRKSLFTTVAVLGMLSAIASQTKAHLTRSHSNLSKLYQTAIASSMPSRSLAKAPTQPHHPIPNGFEIIPLQDSSGHGTLKITNGTTEDAAVKVIDNSSRKVRRFVYVQSNHEVLLERISPCSCSIRFTLGKDWDQTLRKFLQNPSFFQFKNPFDFRETKTAFRNYEITLHPVPNGNARTTPLSDRDFWVDSPLSDKGGQCKLADL